MIPKQTPVRNFRPAAPCCLPLHTSFPVDLPREKSLRASLSSSQSIPSARNRTRQKYLVSQSFVTAQRRSRTACYLALPASSSVPPFPQGLSREGTLCAYHFPLETYGFQTAQHDMMTCIAKKKRSPFRGFSQVCVWRDSNPRPSESESDALSSCATNTKYPTTIPCFAPESKAIFYSRLFRLCSAGFS